MSTNNLHERLLPIARESKWFGPALVAVRSQNLPSWCIGAGAVRNLVWDSLHGSRTPSPLSDIDVARFDSSDLPAESDTAIQRRLSRLHPSVRWEVVNQAAVHTWFEATFGYPVSPLNSLKRQSHRGPNSQHQLWHMEFPFACARMLARLLRREGHEVGHRRARTLMKRISIEALYCKPNTIRREAQHKIWPYLLRGMKIEQANQAWPLDRPADVTAEVRHTRCRAAAGSGSGCKRELHG
jgi:hypothetical protein